MSQAPKRKVAILGGGLAGLTTAYELSESDAFEITVYQMGWRLGGKVATSRNADHGDRIEEHGIHVLFGAYENTFHVLRRAYTKLGLQWQDAFDERSEFTLMENVDKRWIPWIVGMPRQPGNPGDALDAKSPSASVPFLITDVLGWLRGQVLAYFAGTPLERPARWFFGSTIGRAERSAESMRQKSERTVNCRSDARWLLAHLRWNLFLIRVVGWIGHLLWTVLRPFLTSALGRRDNIRRLWIGAELAVATAAGLTKAALQGRQVRDLDHQDLREWLQANGVIGSRISRTSSDSACLRMVYEVVFAYAGGDPSKPGLAAGTAVRDLLRLLFDRRGALAYTMRAGSAETLITPLYRVLHQRRVRFEFFHRIDRVHPTPDGSHIGQIDFTRQARPTAAEYDPLIYDGAWPDRPKYELLQDGQKLKDSESKDGRRDLEMPTFDPPTASTGSLLRRSGDQTGDFDLVVLALPVEVLRTVCAPITAQSQAWRTMLDNAQTTPTQSVQLWFDQTTAELGWKPPGATEPAMLGAYAQPFGSWLDLSVTLEHERWKGSGLASPKSVAYLCGPLDESIPSNAGREVQLAHVQKTAQTWLGEFAEGLWPGAYHEKAFILSRLVGPAHENARYQAQFFRANTNPSDRYTLTLPGSTRFRLAPHESGFANMYLAGDWTANGFDVGCVEATVMSGRLAARAAGGLRADQMPVYGEAPMPISAAPRAVKKSSKVSMRPTLSSRPTGDGETRPDQ
jgi:uncharacterized protein with NAD-binding domain and iron-sulfur cluster